MKGERLGTAIIVACGFLLADATAFYGGKGGGGYEDEDNHDHQIRLVDPRHGSMTAKGKERPWVGELTDFGPGSFFETWLPPAQEKAFQAWKKEVAPKDSGKDYDWRGAWKAGAKADIESGHWPDTWKKPNHPTFSTESKYYKWAKDKAGHWGVRGEWIPAKKEGERK